MHALTDAILGAIGEADIGKHFPPSDPQWKGAPSSIFLLKAMELLGARKGIIANADLTILAEAPKIGPHIAAMKAVLAPLLQVARPHRHQGHHDRGNGCHWPQGRHRRLCRRHHSVAAVNTRNRSSRLRQTRLDDRHGGKLHGWPRRCGS
jgi:hypothetical protein